MPNPSLFVRFLTSKLLCFVASAFVFSSSGSAADWTRFRGPNGSGIGESLNLPENFSEKDWNWKIELPGEGHSSPVISKDRIFVTCNPKGTTKRVAVCVNAADGKILWQKEYDTQEFRQHSDNSYASMTPAVDDERVYLWWGSPQGSNLLALDQKDGREVWRKDLGPFVSMHGPGTSPIVYEDMVLLNFDQDEPPSFLLSVDAKTGNERWRLERKGTMSTASTPCIFQPKNGAAEVILISQTIGMTAVDIHNGTVVWELPGLMPKRCVASPIITENGLIVAQCGEGRSESLVRVVRPSADGKSAEKAYEVIRTGGYVPTPLALDEFLFLWKEDGLVTCLRSATNEQVWSQRVQGPFYGSPVEGGGRLYNITRRGDLVVLKAGDQFQEIARIPLGEGSHATPAISGGHMYLRTFTHLISAGK